MTDLDTIAELVSCPEGAMVTEAVLCVGYVDTEGKPALAFTTVGDSNLTTLVGLLAWAQTTLIIDHNEQDAGQ